MQALLGTRRFLPLFVTQFLGAFNDNFFKNAMLILITYRIASSEGMQAAQLVNLAYGVFILPLFLFSALAGQVADKVDRSRVARLVKIAEILLALVGAAGLYMQSLPVLLATLFGFGVHSAFFGPVKYAILPQHLAENELLAGNAYVDASTFLAILIGTIAGGKLVLLDAGIDMISALMVGSAVFGYLASRNIPPAPAPAPDLKISFNLVRDIGGLIRQVRPQREVFMCILGISWFWLIGALFLAQIPPFAKDVLHADKDVVVLFLTMFAVGIAVGSIACSRVMRGAVHAKPVPIAALGMTIFALRLSTTSGYAQPAADGSLMSIATFMQERGSWRILFDFFALAVCGGFYSVPLYTLLQRLADKERCARVISCNNLMNAFFMVVASVLAMAMLKLQFTIPQIFLVVGIMNAFVAIYICKLLPFPLIGGVLRLFYRVEVKGLENYEKAGARVLIIANHTSWLDALLMAAFLPERVTFAINTYIAQSRWLKPLLSLVDTFALDPTNPLAVKSLIEAVRQNRKVMIFPEGRITRTGALMKVYEGPGMIADKSEALVLPIRLEGAQYTPFSYLKGKVRIRLFPKITMTILPPRAFTLPPEVKGRKRRQLAGAQLYDLMSDMVFASSPLEKTLMQSLIEARNLHGSSHVIAEDPQRRPLSYGQFLMRSFILARLLKRITTKNEQRIGLMLPNVVASAVAFFAVQSIGRVAAMINFTSGPAQVSSACRATQLKTVITSKRFIETAKLQHVVEALMNLGVHVHYLEDLQPQLRLSDKLYGAFARTLPSLALKLNSKAEPDDPAVLLFTSGSEGTPKGVVLSHRNILANRYQLASRVDFGPQDTVFNCLPMFHAFGLTGATLLPLLSGIRTFFYPSPLHYRIVPELIYDTNATIMFGTDTFLAGYARFAHPYDCHTLRYVFSGAEKVKDETRRMWIEKFGVRLMEGYGATETAPVISVNTAMHYKTGTVGRLLSGMKVRFESVPGIENGQCMLVSGPNIMKGYMKEDKPGELQALQNGWYNTGDIVSIDPDGYISIIGRTKRFAKIGGEMVSMTAVESLIASLWPMGIHAVVSIPDQRKGEALVLLTDNEAVTLDNLPEAFRKSGLPELSLPRRLIKLKQLPLLGSGKVDYISARALVLEQVTLAEAV